ncbi:hypothetical protein SAMN05216360_112120 [Methylobacterium phyllostachyos]|uniref:Uncharacterized protein n=1 Tax=Methylobacterium phyllostachyos TaxID=582672 RepID=A0A1H0F4N1_9HYPH|nr:hypothetical protein [Methylobacterium phyllostachyos]SDN89543.1 hypothetical protein SAMN05216360_112120 [Methylobacterium phyllostachyos]
MPVGIGIGRGADLRPGVARSLRFSGPDGFHAGALWLAATIPVMATLLLLVRLAS